MPCALGCADQGHPFLKTSALVESIGMCTQQSPSIVLILPQLVAPPAVAILMSLDVPAARSTACEPVHS
jgi:hypothetical protein